MNLAAAPIANGISRKGAEVQNSELDPVESRVQSQT